MGPSESKGPAAGPPLVGVTALAGVAGVIRAARPILHGPDPFWHVDIGRRMVSTGSLLRADPYSFLTPGQDWILTQWGTDLIIGLMDAIGGLWLVAVVASIVVTASVALTGREMWRRSPSLATVAVLALVLLASIPGWVLRGNLATLVLLPLLLRELGRVEPRVGRVALLMVLWANLHAVFLLGVALIMIDSLARVVVPSANRRSSLRRGALLSATSLVAGLLTPYGPRYLTEVLGLAWRGGDTGIVEWAPTAVTDLQVLPYTLLVAIVLVAVAVSARGNDLPRIATLVAGILFGLAAQRNVASASIIVGIVGAPYVAMAWRDLSSRIEHTTPRKLSSLDRALVVVVGVLGLLAVIVTAPRSGATDAHADGIPLTLIRQLDELDREARVTTMSSWAPAVSTLTDDHIRTEVDGRAELFTSTQREEHLQLHGAMPRWDRTLDAWCVTDALVLEDAPLREALSDSNDWRLEGTGPVIAQPESDAAWFTRNTPISGCDPHGATDR